MNKVSSQNHRQQIVQYLNFFIKKIIPTEDNKEGFKRYLKYKFNKENFMVLTVSLVGQMASGPKFVKLSPKANNKKYNKEGFISKR